MTSQSLFIFVNNLLGGFWLYTDLPLVIPIEIQFKLLVTISHPIDS